jgi:hypothetical protein
MAMIREALTAHVSRTLALAKVPNPAAAAATIVALETKIARCMPPGRIRRT